MVRERGGGVEVGGVVMEEERRWRGEEERRRVVVGEGGLPGRGEDNGIEDKGSRVAAQPRNNGAGYCI